MSIELNTKLVISVEQSEEGPVAITTAPEQDGGTALHLTVEAALEHLRELLGGGNGAPTPVKPKNGKPRSKRRSKEELFAALDRALKEKGCPLNADDGVRVLKLRKARVLALMQEWSKP